MDSELYHHWVQNTYGLINLRSPKIYFFLKFNQEKFQCEVKISLHRISKVTFKFHTKYFAHTLKHMYFVQI